MISSPSGYKAHIDEVSGYNTAVFNSATYHGEYQEREFVRKHRMQDPQ